MRPYTSDKDGSYVEEYDPDHELTQVEKGEAVADEAEEVLKQLEAGAAAAAVCVCVCVWCTTTSFLWEVREGGEQQGTAGGNNSRVL